MNVLSVGRKELDNIENELRVAAKLKDDKQRIIKIKQAIKDIRKIKER